MANMHIKNADLEGSWEGEGIEDLGLSEGCRFPGGREI